ncbi:unnamed protein product [Prorocentrum cordatum]|uniref:Uncharacterized protein n=1 Tax=Prorocentrum cordatum TaxID=2364126 RepID=A0ABN9TVF6_9DINO|nr:unnamed protein product [Polarella glacialis]
MAETAMPSWMKRPAAEALGSAPARDQKDDYRMLVIVLAKLVRTGARQIATLESAVYESYFASEDGEETIGHVPRVAWADYEKTSGELKQKQKNGEVVDFRSRGAPHVRVFINVLRRILELAKAGAVHADESIYGPIKEYWETVILHKAPSEIGADALHFRCKKARKDSADAKGVPSMAACMKNPLVSAMWTAALGHMVRAQKIERVAGPAPKGPLEREVSRIVTEMQQK